MTGANGVALELRELSKTYAPGRPVLHGIDLAVQGSGITAVIGPSGTGKPTLIRCINRLVEPSAGEIRRHGQRISRGCAGAPSPSRAGASAWCSSSTISSSVSP